MAEDEEFRRSARLCLKRHTSPTRNVVRPAFCHHQEAAEHDQNYLARHECLFPNEFSDCVDMNRHLSRKKSFWEKSTDT